MNPVNKKKIIILDTPWVELANQLWNYISIYAYCLERGYDLENPAFYEYGTQFSMSAVSNPFIENFFFLPFKNYYKRKFALKRRIWRKFYVVYASSIRFFRKNILLNNEEVYYLPPTKEADRKLMTFEQNTHTVYFDGWLFRNPVGIKKYRKEIRAYFSPSKDISISANTHIAELRKKYKHIIGVHIRQGDYKTWRGGIYFVDQRRVKEILEEYLVFSNKKADETCFVIASDGKIDKNIFPGLNVAVSKKTPVEDLFILSMTDCVLGSDSTFGNFAAYYANIPHVVLKKEAIDWAYYSDKKTYFPNKYCTWVHY